MAPTPVKFWLATFETDRPPPATVAATAPLLGSPFESSTGKIVIAIEVLNRGAECAVAIATANDVEHPSELACGLGFANGVAACDLARESGFPVVEATITFRPADGLVTVVAPFFAAKTESDANVIRYEEPLLAIGGVEFREAKYSDADLEVTYRQTIVAPDAARPDMEIATLPARWRTSRTGTVRWQPAEIALQVASARYPELAPLATAPIAAPRVWSGSMSSYPELAPIRVRQGPSQPEPRVDTVTSLAYRFEDVELLGFRIDLGQFGREADRLLESLISPLNFHRIADAAELTNTARLADFRYGAAARAVVIELLRYGKMKLDDPPAPMEPDDYQSQHELLVRVLVGRLDDDTAQARDPAVFVPAIFVDNPWSKVVGRELQGFDKQLARFCVAVGDALQPLRPDGCLCNDARQGPLQPLERISQVRLVPRVGQDGGALLDLDYGSTPFEENAFTAIDLPLALGQSWLAGVRWRQPDFDATEFRRAFARPMIANGLTSFRSVQVTPVDARGLEKTWIQGTFALDRVRLAFPAGVAALTLHAPPGAPEPWQRLCDLLERAGARTLGLPTGDWYRLKCAMELRIDDGLAW